MDTDAGLRMMTPRRRRNKTGKLIFGKKAPKTEGQIITYAQRWAKRKNLPFSKRN
jgi:hypothetical protein